jgi:hypothetical protein
MDLRCRPRRGVDGNNDVSHGQKGSTGTSKLSAGGSSALLEFMIPSNEGLFDGIIYGIKDYRGICVSILPKQDL